MKIIYLFIFLLLFLNSPTLSQQSSQACSRECLENFVDKYLEAVIAHDPARIPIAKNIKVTENGQRLVVGDGLWNTASAKGLYKLYIADHASR